jgi:hypothetical protein
LPSILIAQIKSARPHPPPLHLRLPHHLHLQQLQRLLHRRRSVFTIRILIRTTLRTASSHRIASKLLVQDHRQPPPLQAILALLHRREDQPLCYIRVGNPSNVMYVMATILRTTPRVRVDLKGQHGLLPLFRPDRIHRHHRLPRRSPPRLNHRMRIPPLLRPPQPRLRFVAMQSILRQAVRPLHRLHHLLCQRTLSLYLRALSIAVSLQLLWSLLNSLFS